MSTEKPLPIKAIIYTDAGFDLIKPITFSGYGIHGYTFTDEVPKRGTGNPKAIPTNNGYVGPLDDKGAMVEGEKVTVQHYIDIVGGARHHRSSGEAELNSFILALEWLKEQSNISELIIYCDAKFVTLGITSRVAEWEKNKWRLSSGEQPKYVDRWQYCWALWMELTAKLPIKLLWMKGHNGNIGNDRADALATKGKSAARNFETVTPHISVSVAQGYWKTSSEAPRLLQAPRWYFNTRDSDEWEGVGYNYLYTGCHGPKEKDPELLGKPYADNHLAVLRLSTLPPQLLELRRTAQLAPTAHLNKVVVADLTNILTPKAMDDFDQYGFKFHLSSDKEIYIKNASGQYVLGEMKPPGQGYRMVQTWRLLRRHLDDLINGDTDYSITDITDFFFEKMPKKDTYALKKSFTQQVKYVDIKTNFNLSIGCDPTKAFVQKVRLILGQDILGRNQLAALSDDIEAVKVVSWRDSDQIGRYGTWIIMKNGDCGLWSRYEANFIITKSD